MIIRYHCNIIEQYNIITWHKHVNNLWILITLCNSCMCSSFQKEQLYLWPSTLQPLQLIEGLKHTRLLQKGCQKNLRGAQKNLVGPETVTWGKSSNLAPEVCLQSWINLSKCVWHCWVIIWVFLERIHVLHFHCRRSGERESQASEYHVNGTRGTNCCPAHRSFRTTRPKFGKRDRPFSGRWGLTKYIYININISISILHGMQKQWKKLLNWTNNKQHPSCETVVHDSL